MKIIIINKLIMRTFIATAIAAIASATVMNDVDFPVADVLAGIEAAHAAGLGPIKVNMVVKRGTNDDQIVPLARHVREHFGTAVVLRFIEYMDVGATNGWRMDEVLPSAQVLQRLQDALSEVRRAKGAKVVAALVTPTAKAITVRFTVK